ncbi:unnamed protein product [Larinioides sclopetarius]|uniref:Ion transport domain-containing protein n=1 Tax=Larinioides sclopetarius TaxID=280406 RepID=A0AAV2A2C6_9ARAC
MSPAEAADIVVTEKGHNFTQGVGRTLFAVYELLMIIALVNTLIAILSNTFQKVVDNADVEFKFHRTKQWMHFFDESTLVPSPFNLIPSVSFFRNLATFCSAMTKKSPEEEAKFSWQRCCYVERLKDVTVDANVYEALMSNLVQRYFRAKEGDE